MPLEESLSFFSNPWLLDFPNPSSPDTQKLRNLTSLTGTGGFNMAKSRWIVLTIKTNYCLIFINWRSNRSSSLIYFVSIVQDRSRYRSRRSRWVSLQSLKLTFLFLESQIFLPPIMFLATQHCLLEPKKSPIKTLPLSALIGNEDLRALKFFLAQFVNFSRSN